MTQTLTASLSPCSSSGPLSPPAPPVLLSLPLLLQYSSLSPCSSTTPPSHPAPPSCLPSLLLSLLSSSPSLGPRSLYLLHTSKPTWTRVEDFRRGTGPQASLWMQGHRCFLRREIATLPATSNLMLSLLLSQYRRYRNISGLSSGPCYWLAGYMRLQPDCTPIREQCYYVPF